MKKLKFDGALQTLHLTNAQLNPTEPGNSVTPHFSKNNIIGIKRLKSLFNFSYYRAESFSHIPRIFCVSIEIIFQNYFESTLVEKISLLSTVTVSHLHDLGSSKILITIVEHSLNRQLSRQTELHLVVNTIEQYLVKLFN